MALLSFLPKINQTNVSIYYFSYTGNSKKIAEYLGKQFNITPYEIKSFQFPYIIWLLTSFIPFFPVKSKWKKIEDNKQILILCFPKWTFNCAPVTYFLIKCPCKNLIFIITHKGWGISFYEKIYKFLCLILKKHVKMFFINIKQKKDLEKDLSDVFKSVISEIEISEIEKRNYRVYSR